VVLLKLPVPPTELEVKRMEEVAGSPEGLGFPNSSTTPRVATTELPEVTVDADRERVLNEGETIPEST